MAAGMGNIVGDVAGIWLGGTIEHFSNKNTKDPALTSEQLRSTGMQTLKTS